MDLPQLPNLEKFHSGFHGGIDCLQDLGQDGRSLFFRSIASLQLMQANKGLRDAYDPQSLATIAIDKRGRERAVIKLLVDPVPWNQRRFYQFTALLEVAHSSPRLSHNALHSIICCAADYGKHDVVKYLLLREHLSTHTWMEAFLRLWRAGVEEQEWMKQGPLGVHFDLANARALEQQLLVGVRSEAPLSSVIELIERGAPMSAAFKVCCRDQFAAVRYLATLMHYHVDMQCINSAFHPHNSSTAMELVMETDPDCERGYFRLKQCLKHDLWEAANKLLDNGLVKLFGNDLQRLMEEFMLHLLYKPDTLCAEAVSVAQKMLQLGTFTVRDELVKASRLDSLPLVEAFYALSARNIEAAVVSNPFRGTEVALYLISKGANWSLALSTAARKNVRTLVQLIQAMPAARANASANQLMSHADWQGLFETIVESHRTAAHATLRTPLEAFLQACPLEPMQCLRTALRCKCYTGADIVVHEFHLGMDQVMDTACSIYANSMKDQSDPTCQLSMLLDNFVSTSFHSDLVLHVLSKGPNVPQLIRNTSSSNAGTLLEISRKHRVPLDWPACFHSIVYQMSEAPRLSKVPQLQAPRLASRSMGIASGSSANARTNVNTTSESTTHEQNSMLSEQGRFNGGFASASDSAIQASNLFPGGFPQDLLAWQCEIRVQNLNGGAAWKSCRFQSLLASFPLAQNVLDPAVCVDVVLQYKCVRGLRPVVVAFGLGHASLARMAAPHISKLDRANALECVRMLEFTVSMPRPMIIEQVMCCEPREDVMDALVDLMLE